MPDHARKTCFVTIGATAAFNSLLKAALEPSFIQALHDAKYTDLLLQYGSDGKAIFDKGVSEHGDDYKQRLGVQLSGFDFKKAGLAVEMRLAKGANRLGNEEGVVISHAGSGSILEALRIGVPLIVVPNTDLLHNHQVELAEELAKQDYVIHGKIDKLSLAIDEAEKLRQRMQAWPPANNDEGKGSRALEEVMNQEMGWVD